MSGARLRPLVAPGRRRVLVVDDSAFMRRLVSDVVQSSGEFEVVGTARDGEDALRQVASLNPDLITLDVDMPGLDGLGALRRIMREAPRPVVMLSAGGSDGGADATLRALDAGAVEFVRKPSGAISLDLESVGERLLEALRAAAVATLQPHKELPPHLPPVALRTAVDAPRLRAVPPRDVAPSQLVVMAASTGGPAALAELVASLPSWPDTTVLIVQHMPAGFTASFAKRLHARAAMPVREAEHDQLLAAGTVVVAPGGFHVRVVGPREAPRMQLDQTAPLWGVRPAADPLFASAAALYGQRVIGVVLTGMGRDGAEGMRMVRAAGGQALVQELSSCVVPGMPEAALRLAGADALLPLPELAAELAVRVRRMSDEPPPAALLDEGWPDDDDA